MHAVPDPLPPSPRLVVRAGPAAHRTSVGSDRPSSPECRCPLRPRCVGSGWSPWCAAGLAGAGRDRGGKGAAAAAPSRRHGPDQAARTLAHGSRSLGPGRTPRRPSAPPSRGTLGNGVPSPPKATDCCAQSTPFNYISQDALRPGPLKLLTSAPGQTKWTRIQRGGTINRTADCPSVCIPSAALTWELFSPLVICSHMDPSSYPLPFTPL